MATDDFIFWCAPSVDEEEDIGFEDEMPVEDEHDLGLEMKDKGKARESMYVTLVEGVVCPSGRRFHADPPYSNGQDRPRERELSVL